MSTDRDLVRTELSQMLRPLTTSLLPGDEITDDTRFGEDLGLESLALANLSGRLQARYGPAANLVPFLAERAPGPLSEIRIGEFVDYLAGVVSANGANGANGGNSANGAASPAGAAVPGQGDGDGAMTAMEMMRIVMLDDPEDYRTPHAGARAGWADMPDNDNAAVLRERAPGVVRRLLNLTGGDVEAFVAGDGPTLVAMHPVNVGAGVFARQFADLAKDYRVVCVHNPGVGATTWDADLTIAGLARMQREALDALDAAPPFHVLGSSFGGVIAQEFVLAHPAECASLALVGSSYRAGARGGGLRALEDIVAEEFDLLYGGNGVTAPSAGRAELEKLLRRCESMDTRIGLGLFAGLRSRPSHYARLPRIPVPTLVVRGRQDTMVPEPDAHVLYGAIPGARFAELPDAGHFPCLTHPDEIGALLGPFLAGRAEPAPSAPSGTSTSSTTSSPSATAARTAPRAVPAATEDAPPGLGRCVVIGTGRCGSTMLSKLIAREPETLSMSESLGAIRGRLLIMPLTVFSGAAYWRMIGSAGAEHADLLSRMGVAKPNFAYPPTGRYAADEVPPILRIALPNISDDPDSLYDMLAERVPHFPAQPVALHHRMMLDLMATMLGRRRWVERTGASSMLAYPWLSANTDARVIHLTRDVKATARSMSRHPAFKMSAIRHEFHVRYGADPFVTILNRPLPPAAELPPEMRRLLPENLTRQTLEEAQFDLSFYETLIAQMEGAAEQAFADLKPRHLLRVRYEDIVSEPVAELTRVGEFIGFADPAGWAARVAPTVKGGSVATAPAG